jgi:hypothetical protein
MWSRLITEDQRERKVTYADLFFRISPAPMQFHAAMQLF